MSNRLESYCHAFLCIVALVLYALVCVESFPFLNSHAVLDEILYQNPLIGFVNFSFRIDQLSSFFAILIAFVSAVATVYLFKYADEYKGKYSLIKLSLATLIFSLSMIGVVLASHVFTFLFFWELMSLSSYLLVIYDHKDRKNVEAGFIYFLMTHVATALLLVAFLLLSGNTHQLSFSHLFSSSVQPEIAAIIFVMFLFGAGIKAGVIPFHFWLPIAHPVAPSHVSALMSALMVKTPIYLLIRVIFDFLKPELYMGYSMLALGLASALLGIIYALRENDIKKLLAYSTIENIGIILIALSLALIFHTLKHENLASLALVASFFHIFNHAIYKAALFMGAGSVVSATHIKDLNHLGGLIKRMPKTSISFLIVTMSIMALPFLNGFVSEWLIYQSLIKGMQINFTSLPFILPLTLMLFAMVAGLAFVTFSKLFATVFLAYPRSQQAANALEVSPLMYLPMALLAGVCIFIGIKPQLISGFWINVLTQLKMPEPITVPYLSWFPDLINVSEVAVFPTEAMLVVVLLMLIFLILLKNLFKTSCRRAIPWLCGHEALGVGFMELEAVSGSVEASQRVVETVLPRAIDHQAQYNANSFSQTSLRLMRNFYRVDFADFFIRLYTVFHQFSKNFRDRIQSGDLHLYLFYILIAVIGGLIYAKSF